MKKWRCTICDEMRRRIHAGYEEAVPVSLKKRRKWSKVY